MELVNIRGLVLDLLQELEDHIGKYRGHRASLEGLAEYVHSLLYRTRQIAPAPPVLPKAFCLPEASYPSSRMSGGSPRER